MTRRAILLSVRREYSLGWRVLFALLALIQLIAPTWHVCEMGGGGHACCPSETLALQHCERATASTPTTSTSARKAHCSRCPQPAPNAAELHQTPAPLGENCLAKLLLGMPWQSAAVPMQCEYSVQSRAYRTRAYCFPHAFVSLLPPGRAPPLFS